jgi:hypothetical protein
MSTLLVEIARPSGIRSLRDLRLAVCYYFLLLRNCCVVSQRESIQLTLQISTLPDFTFELFLCATSPFRISSQLVLLRSPSFQVSLCHSHFYHNPVPWLIPFHSSTMAIHHKTTTSLLLEATSLPPSLSSSLLPVVYPHLLVQLLLVSTRIPSTALIGLFAFGTGELGQSKEDTIHGVHQI